MSGPTLVEERNTTGLASTWGLELEAAVCEQCDWSYLLPQGSLPLYCPHCFQVQLTPLTEPVDQLPYARPPERLLHFTVTADRLTRSIQTFAGGIWFAPGDLKPQTLQERLQRLYLPMWLVDSQIEATWQAEAGFDYQVVSHQDHFDQNRNGWVSREITRTRIRWEPRLGRLVRTYHNIAAPALEEHLDLQRKLGQYDLAAAQPFRPEALASALIRLPNRPPDDAWPEAVPVIKAVAAQECQQACRSDHLREFRWSAAYHNHNWTLLLLPVYVTYYLDDNKDPQPILIHGQTGQLHGPRRASMQRAQRTALIIVAVAVFIFVVSLIAALASLMVSRLLVVAGVGLALATVIGLLALVPIIVAWQFNRANSLSSPRVETLG